MKKSTSKDGGVSKLTVLIFGLISYSIGYAAFKITPFYYCYYELQNQMDGMAKLASELTDDEIKYRINMTINECGIPVGIEELKMARFDGKIQMSLSYTEEFYITWDGKDHTLRVFPFLASVERNYEVPGSNISIP